MNKFLIVEDDNYKFESVDKFLKEKYGDISIIHRESITSGLSELITNDAIEFIILDMSMPIYDISDEDPKGGGAENFGGKEFLEQMQLRGINTPVVVLSQLNSFGKGSYKKTLPILDKELTLEFPEFYKGSVFYSSANCDWMLSIINILEANKK